MRLSLTHHVIIIVVFASCTDEEGCAQQWSRASSNLVDFGDVVGKRSRVNEHMLVETEMVSKLGYDMSLSQCDHLHRLFGRHGDVVYVQ